MDKKQLLEIQKLCIQKTRLSMTEMNDNLRGYKNRKDGQYFIELKDESSSNESLPLEHIFVWTHSFFTGMACLSYEATYDPKFLQWLNLFYKRYYSKVFDTPTETMHDLGFLYVPYAVALYKLTNDSNMKEIAIKAAEELAKRYYPKGNYIRAWGRLDDKIPDYVDDVLAKDHFFQESKGLAIIDSMMNLPLLYWASKETGNPHFANIANAHADMTMKHFIRDDYSVAHGFRFDEKSGKPLGINNYCGYSEDSYWSRGTAWAIYGFVIAYSYTKNPIYLETAIHLSDGFIRQTKKTFIPYWDFRLPDSEPKAYDTSAGAICACAFLELANYDNQKNWLNYADVIIDGLASEHFLNRSLQCPGLLSGSNGNDTYWICGDYFFMEAVSRRIGSTIGYW